MSCDGRARFPEARRGLRTYYDVPRDDDAGVPSPRPALDDGQGHRLELPDAIFAALRQITAAMSQGMGVTITPYGAMLTTQEAAELLGTFTAGWPGFRLRGPG